MPLRPLIAIAGPTGAGKSALALALAHQFGGEIVNFDSLQVYRGFDIGSAKLPIGDRQEIPHHLIDIVEPAHMFTAGDFAALCKRLLPAISGAYRLPILCGGTGFYLRALLHGLSPTPQRDGALREALLEREARRPGAIARLLRRLDPSAAGRIHANDRNKSLRALELRLLAARPVDEHFAELGLQPLEGYLTLTLALNPPRAALQQQLDRRCEQIWHGGLLQEVQALLASGLPAEAKPFEAIGYKQALQHLQNEQPAEQALEEMKTRTRQYAKRQWTWFRAQPNVTWLSGFGSSPDTQELAVQQVGEYLENFSTT